MPKVKHPDLFEEAVRTAISTSLKAEVLIPFESHGLATRFRQRCYDYVRACRAHNIPNAEKTYEAFHAKFYSTADVRRVRPEYNPGPDFPYTILIDGRNQYELNVANMTVSGATGELPTRMVDPDINPLPYLDDAEYVSDEPGDEERVDDIFNILSGDS